MMMCWYLMPISTHIDVAIYFALASCRSYADYKVNGTLSLELQKAPVDPRLYLDDRGILPIKDNLIHFLYEETPTSSNQH